MAARACLGPPSRSSVSCGNNLSVSPDRPSTTRVDEVNVPEVACASSGLKRPRSTPIDRSADYAPITDDPTPVDVDEADAIEIDEFPIVQLLLRPSISAVGRGEDPAAPQPSRSSSAKEIR